MDFIIYFIENASSKFIEALPGIAAIIAALAASKGLEAWKNEFLGKRNTLLIENVLTLFYKAKSAFRSIRSIFGQNSEHITLYDDSIDISNMSREEINIRNRYHKYSELFDDIEANKYIFMARFGKKTEKYFDDLHNLATKLFIAATFFTAAQKSRANDDPKERRFYLDVIYDTGNADNDFTVRLNNIIEEISSFCENELKRYYRSSL